MSDTLKNISDAFSYNQKFVALLESFLSEIDKTDKNLCDEVKKTIQHFKGGMASCLKLLNHKH